ncbi:MAG: hypothetical protein IK062_00600 [Selenomonadaceae bacterium]|nr:hypothetical protein [Selenomonadaceae bacterium]
MGQYYRVILGNTIGTACKVFDRSVDGEYIGAKLMEHSWWKNDFVNAFAEKLYLHKKRVCWVGDYANEPEDFNFDFEVVVNIPSYQEVWGENVKLCGVKKSDFTLDNKFLLNYTTKEFIDLNEYKEKSMDKQGWIIHPLPLLTAVGNDRGGGDFHKGNIGFKNVGIWAWNLISISDKVSKSFKKFDLVYKEEPDKIIQVMTLEIDLKSKKILQHVRKIDSENILDEMYKIIGCDLVELVEIEVEGKFYDVYCDEEFLLKNNPVPTLFIDSEQILCGNLIFTTRDEEGNAADITNDDVKKLTKFISKQENKLRGYFAKLK